MKRHEIESLAREIIDRVKVGQRVEDQLYELKADWPDHADAALRIAAHGNAARGESVLWLIGVDENRGVTGASAVDPATWYPQIERHFDGHAPEMRPVNFSVEGRSVVALLFGTERAPFVVKNPKGGYPEFSVPWREGTRLRAAKRDELLRILSPLQRLPSFDVLGAAVERIVPESTRNQVDVREHLWGAALKVFVNLKGEKRIVIPFYRCSGELTFIPQQNFRHSFDKVYMQPFSKSSTIVASDTEVRLDDAGALRMVGELRVPLMGGRPGGEAHVTFNIYTTDVDRPAIIDLTIPLRSDLRQWEWGEPVTVFEGGVTVFRR